MCVKFEGQVWKEGNYWPVEVTALDISTQGKSKKDAYSMMKEAIELHVDRSGFKVEIVPTSGKTFVVKARGSDNDKYLIALLLKQQRARHGLSTAEVAKRLGITAQSLCDLEKGRRIPSIERAVKIAKKLREPLETWVTLAISDMMRAAHLDLKVEVIKKASGF